MVVVLMVELMESGLVMSLEKRMEIPKEMSKEIRLGLLLEGLMVTQMVMMTDINSANPTAHQ